jgi:hypothetical protein
LSDFRKLLPAAPLRLTATAGLAGTETAKDGTQTWIVRACTFAFTSRSAVPATSAALGTGLAESPSATISILPMQVSATSQHLVTISRDGKPFAAPCTATEIGSGVPAAMWGPGGGRTLAAPDKQLVTAVTGLDIAVNPPALAPSPGVIALGSTLGYDVLPPSQPVPVTAASSPAGPVPAADPDTVGKIAAQIASDPVQAARNAVHEAITGFGFAAGANAPMIAFARHAGELFTDEPLVVS